MFQSLPKWLNHFTFLPEVCECFNFSTSSPTLVIISLFVFCYTLGVEQYLTVFLSYTSFIVNDVEQLFLCFLPICISSLEFLIVLFLFFITELGLFTYSGYKILIGYMMCKSFLLLYGLSLAFLIMSFEEGLLLILMKFKFIFFFCFL